MTEPLRVIEVCSGIGGFSLGFQREGFKIIGHSEIEVFPDKVYHHHFPESECLGDLYKINWEERQCDVLCGSWNCQPFSSAGKHRGMHDERDTWDGLERALRGIRPRYAVFENVSEVLNANGGRYWNRILSGVYESGYNAEWQVIAAGHVGAAHLRERLWMVAYPCEVGMEGRFKEPILGKLSLPLRQISESFPRVPKRFHAFKSRLCRTLHGLPFGVHRTKALGNSLVPQIPQVIAKRIKEREGLIV